MNNLCVEKDLSEFACSLISWGLYFGYFLITIALLSAVILPFINALKNPKVLMRAGIGIGILVVVFLFAFVVSGNGVNQIAASQGVTPTDSKLIGAGLIVFYLALITAAIGLIYSEVNKALK